MSEKKRVSYCVTDDNSEHNNITLHSSNVNERSEKKDNQKWATEDVKGRNATTDIRVVRRRQCFRRNEVSKMNTIERFDPLRAKFCMDARTWRH